MQVLTVPQHRVRIGYPAVTALSPVAFPDLFLDLFRNREPGTPLPPERFWDSGTTRQPGHIRDDFPFRLNQSPLLLGQVCAPALGQVCGSAPFPLSLSTGLRPPGLGGRPYLVILVIAGFGPEGIAVILTDAEHSPGPRRKLSGSLGGRALGHGRSVPALTSVNKALIDVSHSSSDTVNASLASTLRRPQPSSTWTIGRDSPPLTGLAPRFRGGSPRALRADLALAVRPAGAAVSTACRIPGPVGRSGMATSGGLSRCCRPIGGPRTAPASPAGPGGCSSCRGTPGREPGQPPGGARPRSSGRAGTVCRPLRASRSPVQCAVSAAGDPARPPVGHGHDGRIRRRSAALRGPRPLTARNSANRSPPSRSQASVSARTTSGSVAIRRSSSRSARPRRSAYLSQARSHARRRAALSLTWPAAPPCMRHTYEARVGHTVAVNRSAYLRQARRPHGRQ